MFKKPVTFITNRIIWVVRAVSTFGTKVITSIGNRRQQREEGCWSRAEPGGHASPPDNSEKNLKGMRLGEMELECMRLDEIEPPTMATPRSLFISDLNLALVPIPSGSQVSDVTALGQCTNLT